MALGASGGISTFKRIASASVNGVNVKPSSGVLYGVHASNVNAAAVFLKLYDKATSPSVGPDTPKLTFVIPGATTGGQTFIDLPSGIAFSNGIAIAVTGAVADSDSTVVGTAEQVVHVFYR